MAHPPDKIFGGIPAGPPDFLALQRGITSQILLTEKWQCDNTITQASRLKIHLREIRRKGYAFGDEEVDRHVRAVGAPVLNGWGELVAGLSIAGPVFRIHKKKVPQLSRLMVEYASKISAQIGFQSNTRAGMEKSRLHHKAIVIKNSLLCTDHYLLVLKDGGLSKTVLPGQFINILINQREELLLRRPFSIARTNPEQCSVEVVYRIVGKGTAAMKGLSPGDTLDFLGPLGRGFNLPGQPMECLLIGGGVGIAPLWGLAKSLSEDRNRIIALLGFRSCDYIYGIDVFRDYGVETLVTTDDGSYGLKGLASDHLEEILKRQIDRAYVCGPPLMLKAVIPMLRRAHIKGEVSVEEKMGCGFGACLSCVVNVKINGAVEKQRACTEGPVFDAAEIVLDDEA